MQDISLLDLPDIERRLCGIDLVSLMENAFSAFSQNKSVVPLPGEMEFQSPPGEVHVKYGYYLDSDVYVVKIASSFWDNPRRGLNSSDGIMLVFSKQTGALLSILNDRGRLTDRRTGAAGAVAAKYLAGPDPDIVGVLGTGIQAELQVHALQAVRPCRNLVVWGRNPERASDYARRMSVQGYDVDIVSAPSEVAALSRLIVMATSSRSPLLTWRDIRPGTHITAIGADSADKQELDAEIVRKADLVVTDSRSQAASRGELLHAFGGDVAAIAHVAEIGEIVAGKLPGRTTDEQVTVATFSGLAVQDISIATAVLNCQA
jgi:ornithine cyclodeaminase